MKKIIYILWFEWLLLYFSTNVYSQWFSTTSGTNVDLLTMDLSNEGFLLCGGWDGVILRSVDQGLTWTTKVLTSEKIFQVDAFNNLCIAISDNGFIYRSDDGGETWQLSYSLDLKLRALHIQLPDQIFTGGQGEYFFQSLNQGLTWENIPNITGGDVWLRDIMFADKQNGYLVGDWGRAYKTPNYGYGWFLMNTGVATNLTSVWFPSPDTGFICGLAGTIIKTTDGGLTWNSVYSGQIDFRNLIFLTNNEGYVSASDGIILHTSDGGINWNQEITPVTGILKEFCFIPEINRLLVCGANGTILFKDITVGLDEKGATSRSSVFINVLPNPAKDSFTLRISDLENNTGTLSILTSDHKTISTIEDVFNGDFEVNLTSFPSGIYYYQLFAKHKLVRTGKLIKN